MTDTGGTTTEITISVSDHDNLPAVLDQVRAARGKTVRLEIPDHSPVFLTATEFRTLRDMAESNNVRITLGTSDPLRLQLASMFGLANLERPAPAADSGESTSETSTSFRGWGRAQASSDDETEEDPISVSRRRRTDLYDNPGSDRASRNVGLSEDATFVSLSYLDEDPGARKAQLIGRIVAVALVAALVLLIAVCWSANLTPTVVNSMNMRSMLRGGTGEAFQYQFHGPGFVVVQPSEGPVVPPHSHGSSG